MLDVLIKNANIIDGTGKPAYKGSIGISGGKLVMADGSEEATAVIDASGKYVSPGWDRRPLPRRPHSWLGRCAPLQDHAGRHDRADRPVRPVDGTGHAGESGRRPEHALDGNDMVPRRP